VPEFLRAHVESLGDVAGFLTTIAFAPQLALAWRTKGKGLSWAMLVLFGTGVGLWLAYGILLPSRPVILANGLTELQIVSIVLIKGYSGVYMSARRKDR
jgi:MtN3 and saliva related transmembrane protein